MYEVVRQQTGSLTLPQIFIDGKFVGGCTDVFDDLKSGQLQARLKKRGITVDASVDINPYELLPGWLQPR